MGLWGGDYEVVLEEERSIQEKMEYLKGINYLIDFLPCLSGDNL